MLSEICVRRPVFATVLTLVFLVFGTVGYVNLGLDRFPKIDFPIITVTTRQPGSAPEDIETQITDKIEEAVNHLKVPAFFADQFYGLRGHIAFVRERLKVQPVP